MRPARCLAVLAFLLAPPFATDANSAPARPKPDAPECVTVRPSAEVARFYVDRPWHGGGVARLLMEAALEDIRGRGAHGAWLGVWEHNVRAVRFYAKHGFRDIGAHVFVLGSDVQSDRIMWREIESGQRS